MKVYIEHSDHHNAPIMRTYNSEDEAVHDIAGSEGADEDEVRKELFEESEEFNGSDRWVLITEETARGRSSYWDDVAEAIRAGKDAPP